MKLDVGVNQQRRRRVVEWLPGDGHVGPVAAISRSMAARAAAVESLEEGRWAPTAPSVSHNATGA